MAPFALRTLVILGGALALTACSRDEAQTPAAVVAPGASPAAANAPVTAKVRETRSIPLELQGVTEVGATVRIKNIDLAEDATLVDVSVSYSGTVTNNVKMATAPTYIELANGQKLMLKPPEGNPEMNVVKGDTMNGRLVFMGAVPRDAQQVSLVFNEGSTSDSIIGPFLRIPIPLTAAAAAGPAR